jgi:hypothetical protein
MRWRRRRSLDELDEDLVRRRFAPDPVDVRVEVDSGLAERAGAAAVARDPVIALAPGVYEPRSEEARGLLAHELAHIVQQRGGSGGPPLRDRAALEAQADRAATAVVHGKPVGPLSPSSDTSLRRVSVRDVGRGEHSGMPRVPELLARLDAMGCGLRFRVEDGNLAVTRVPGEPLTEFGRQMLAFVESDVDIPMRMTNRHGLQGDRTSGFTTPVFIDAWETGYVDVDDLIAASDLGLQTILVHLLRERQVTPNYPRRMASRSTDARQPGVIGEFRRHHTQGLDAELAVLRDFFGDPSIRLVDRDNRTFRNDRGDVIRERVTHGRGEHRGVAAADWEVVITATGRVVTPQEYVEMREAEALREQVERERLQGATEHREGAGGVPAP